MEIQTSYPGDNRIKAFCLLKFKLIPLDMSVFPLEYRNFNSDDINERKKFGATLWAEISRGKIKLS